MLSYTNGGYQDLLGPFSQAKYDSATPALWSLLNDLKPDLWRQGSTYPQSIDSLDQLYANGEVAWDMTYGPTETVPFVQKGTWPSTTREFVFQPSGMIGDVSYVAIPYNSPTRPPPRSSPTSCCRSTRSTTRSPPAPSATRRSTRAGYRQTSRRDSNYPSPPQELPLADLMQEQQP